MSMHLEGPWLSTTGKKKGKKKWASAEQKRKAEMLDASWQELQKKWGVELEEKKRRRALTSGNLSSSYALKPPPGRETEKIPSLPFSGGPCTKKPDKIYTGTMIKGIGTMHKSNAVPIFSDEDAVAIAKMRR